MLVASRWGGQYVESCPAAAKCLIFISRNRSRLRYTKFRAQGLWTHLVSSKPDEIRAPGDSTVENKFSVAYGGCRLDFSGTIG